MPADETLVIDINIEEGEALGAVVNEALQVTRIQPNSAASESKLRVGDTLVMSKGVKIRNLKHFYELMRYAPPYARLTVHRPSEKGTSTATANVASGTASTASAAATASPIVPQEDSSIPDSMKNLYVPQAGFQYKMVKIAVAPGEKLGLRLRSHSNRVLVTADPPVDSKCHGQLMMYDRLIDISGMPVTDQHVAQVFLGSSVRSNGHFTSIVERPISDSTKQKLHAELTAKVEPPSVTLAPDVRAIAQEERLRAAAKVAEDFAKRQRGEAPEELKPPGAPHPAARVTFNETSNKRHVIGNDNRGRDLKPVR